MYRCIKSRNLVRHKYPCCLQAFFLGSFQPVLRGKIAKVFFCSWTIALVVYDQLLILCFIVFCGFWSNCWSCVVAFPLTAWLHLKLWMLCFVIELLLLFCQIVEVVLLPLAAWLLSVHGYPIGISKSTQLLKLTPPGKKLKFPPRKKKKEKGRNNFMLKCPDIWFELYLIFYWVQLVLRIYFCDIVHDNIKTIDKIQMFVYASKYFELILQFGKASKG